MVTRWGEERGAGVGAEEEEAAATQARGGHGETGGLARRTEHEL